MKDGVELPKDKLFELGFYVLDFIYGELTIKKGVILDKVFVDVDGQIRLGCGECYSIIEIKDYSQLRHLYKDRNIFLSIIPVKPIDFERVLGYWVKERYNIKVETTFSVFTSIL